MNKDEQLARLLRLKRHETPGPAYFEEFLSEFHAYQENHQAAPASRSGAGLSWKDRVTENLAAMRRPWMTWAALGAYAGLMLLVYSWQSAGPADSIVQPSPAASSSPSTTPNDASASGIVRTGAEKPRSESDLLRGPRGAPLPKNQTLPVSDSPALQPPVPGKRRTAEQPQELNGAQALDTAVPSPVGK